MTRDSSDEPTLDDLFPIESPEASAVLDLLSELPRRSWRREEIIDATHMRPVDILTVLARLTHGGMIENPRPGKYRRIDRPVATID